MKRTYSLGALVWIGTEGVSITAGALALELWANRPGSVWPCSELEELESIRAVFDSNGLLELETVPEVDLSSSELTAWSSDVLRDTLPADHPAWYVTVGQFD
jgi:hypothetical protein